MRAARFFFASLAVKTYLFFFRPSSTAFTLSGLPAALRTLTTAGASGPLGEAGRFLPLRGERRPRRAGFAATFEVAATRRRRPRFTEAAAARRDDSTPPRRWSRIRWNSAFNSLISD